MKRAENQSVREWALIKLVGAQVDFSAGHMHGFFVFRIIVQGSPSICTSEKRFKPNTGLILLAIVRLGNSDLAFFFQSEY